MMFRLHKIFTIILGILFVCSLFSMPLVMAREIQLSPIIKPELLPGPSQKAESGTGEPGEGGQTSTTAPLTSENLESYLTGFVQRFLPSFLGFIAIISVAALIVGGIIFLTAFGNEEKLGTAKKVMQWSIIGLILAMLAFIIVNAILRLPLPT